MSNVSTESRIEGGRVRIPDIAYRSRNSRISDVLAGHRKGVLPLNKPQASAHVEQNKGSCRLLLQSTNMITSLPSDSLTMTLTISALLSLSGSTFRERRYESLQLAMTAALGASQLILLSQ